jgi:hypothetical protein
MSISAPKVKAKAVRCTSEMLEVTLSNGLVLATPLSQFPRLQKGSAEQRKDWELICDGTGIHWERLDEDISVNGLLKVFLQHLPAGALSGFSATRPKTAGKFKILLPPPKAIA